MGQLITYDEHGTQIPSREFLTMVRILEKKVELETGYDTLSDWLFTLGKEEKKEIYKLLKENYLDQETN